MIFEILFTLIIIVLTTLLLLVTLLPYRWSSYRITSLVDKIPGPKKLPIIGTTLRFVNTPNEEFLNIFFKLRAEYGYIFRNWRAGEPFVLSTNLSDIEAILSTKVNITKSIGYDGLHAWLGTGLLTSTGAKWKAHRRLLTPSFHFDILKNYVEIFNQHSKILVEKLKHHSDDPWVNISEYINLCTLDVICETAMGTKINAQTDEGGRYVKCIKRFSELFYAQNISLWFRRDFMWNLTSLGREKKKIIDELQSFSINVIKNRREERRRLKMEGKEEYSEGKKRLTFLDLLLESAEKEGGMLTDEDIREEVDTFMFEGHDTTSVALSWSLFLIGTHLDTQKELHYEQDGIFGDSDRPASTDDIKEMVVLERVLKECMRIYPSVPFISRKLDVEIKLPSGYVLPAGVNFSILPYLIHRIPEIYPDPEEFRPSRFLPEESKNRHPYAYLPFSAGPRNCIGQRFALLELKVVLSSILRNFCIKSIDKREDVKQLTELVLRPKNGIRLKITPRDFHA